MNIKAPDYFHTGFSASLFVNSNLSIAKSVKPAQLKVSGSTQNTAHTSNKSAAAPAADTARHQFSCLAQSANVKIQLAREKLRNNGFMDFQLGPLPQKTNEVDLGFIYKTESLSAGKSDDELMSMAAYSLRAFHHEELEKIADFAELPEGKNTILAPDGSELQLRLMLDTNDQRIQAAKTTINNLGPDIIFEQASIRNELSRATGIGHVDFLGSVESPPAQDFDSSLENLAAYYAFYQKQAADNYSGNELDSIMNMLNSEFDSALTQVIDNFTGNGAATYMQGDLQGIKDSLATIFDERKQYYSNVINDESYKTGVEGTENEWANSTAVFAAGKLLNHSASNPADYSDSAAKYSLTDLNAFCLMKSNVTPDTARNEEHLGLMLGLDAVSVKMLQSSGLSDAGKKQLQDSLELLKIQALNDVNAKMAQSRSDPFRDKSCSYDDFDSNAVNMAINIMLGSLKSDNLAEGLANSFLKLIDQFSSRQSDMYISGSAVQQRYKIFDDARASMLGLSSDEMAFIALGLGDVNLTSNISSLADTLGNDSWHVPNNLLLCFDLTL